jgi:hypothetical protein
MNKSLAVVMTVSSYEHRLAYLRATLASWLHVRDLDKWSFSFFVEPGEFQEDTLLAINRWIAESELTDTVVVCNEGRLGVLGNPWYALDSSFKAGADFTVLVEEDIIVSSGLLEYMSEAHMTYRDELDVLGVCASSFHEQGDPSVMYTAADFCPLVWGTWRDRWYKFLRDTWDKDYSTGNPDGSEAGWDWNIRRRILPRFGMTFVHPQVSRALHIGEFGIHMRPEDFRASQSTNFMQ